jgi:deazaflavin-dependent oxidoreductase (nitroreductase family)
MAVEYKHNTLRKVVDQLIIWMLRANIAPEGYYLLTVKGRKSGLPRSRPVALVEEGDEKWLVAPYGVVNWVHNARAVGKVTLSRGRNAAVYRLEELSLSNRAPILKEYITRYPITRPYFDTQPDSEVAEFEPEAQGRPVFKLHRDSNANEI